MTILLGYVPTREGRAALTAAVDEAKLRAARLVVVNTTRGDRLVDPRYTHDSDLAELEEVLAASGVDHEVRHYTSERLAGDELVALAGELDAAMVVIGMRQRSPVGKLVMGSAARRCCSTPRARYWPSRRRRRLPAGVPGFPHPGAFRGGTSEGSRGPQAGGVPAPGRAAGRRAGTGRRWS